MGGETATHLMMISLVLGRISAFSSSRSSLQPSSAFDRQRLTSAPRDSGTEYSCWYVGYWQMTWSLGPTLVYRARKFAWMAPLVTSTLSAVRLAFPEPLYSAAMLERRVSEPRMAP